MVNKTDLRKLRTDLIEALTAEQTLLPTQRITIACSDRILISNEKFSVEGCGNVLAVFKAWDDTTAIWELIADMYVMHLHNDHGLGETFDPFEK